MRCCVPGCAQRSQKGISFHKFPTKELNRVKEWMDAIIKFANQGCEDKKRFILKTSHVLCSKHFKSSDYIPVQDGRPMLRGTACPSIFLCDPNAKRQRRSRERVTNAVTSVLCKIAPKPELKNPATDITTKSLLPQMLNTQERIPEVKTPFSENISKWKCNSPTTIESRVSITPRTYDGISENCVSCFSLRCENETLKAEIIALKKLVVTLQEKKERSQPLSHSSELVTDGATPDSDNMCSTPTSCRIAYNWTTSYGQDSLASLQKAVTLDHRYESTPRTLKRKFDSSESQKKIMIKKTRLTAKKLKQTQLKVAEMKQIMKSLVEKVDFRPETAVHIKKVFGKI